MMSRKIVILTGANKGLGKSISDQYMKEPFTTVVSLSRRLSEEQEKYGINDNFKFIQLDLAGLKGRESLAILSDIINKDDKIVFINNAAIIQPINAVGNFSDSDIKDILNTNVRPPVIIANYLLAHFMDHRLDLVNISSGASVRGIANWSLYCSSKAFTKMFFETIGIEHSSNKSIRVFNLDPGVMDTGMQESIRSHDFPEIARFRELKVDGGLKNSEQAAMEIIKAIQ